MGLCQKEASGYIQQMMCALFMCLLLVPQYMQLFKRSPIALFNTKIEQQQQDSAFIVAYNKRDCPMCLDLQKCCQIIIT